MTAPVSPSAPVAVEPVSNRYRLVPVAPTLAMVERAVDNCGPVGCCLIESDHAQEIWSAMLAASPAPSMVGLREKIHDLILTGLYFPCDTITDEEDDAIFRTADAILALLAREGVIPAADQSTRTTS